MFYWFLITIIALEILGGLIILSKEEIEPKPRWTIAGDIVVYVALLIGCLLWL